MRPPAPAAVVLTAALLWLGGCSLYRAPTLEVAGVSIAERTEEATRVDFEVELTNPNDEPIELRHVVYSLAVDGRTVYRGRRSAQATLARRGTRRLTLPAVIAAGAGLGAGAEHAYQLEGTVLYLTPGELSEILLDIGLRRPKVRFQRAGVVGVPQ